MRLGTLVHNTTLMSKPHLQELFMAITWLVCVPDYETWYTGTLVHSTTLMSLQELVFMVITWLVCVPDYETWYTGTQHHSNVFTRTSVYGHNLVGLRS